MTRVVVLLSMMVSLSEISVFYSCDDNDGDI